MPSRRAEREWLVMQRWRLRAWRPDEPLPPALAEMTGAILGPLREIVRTFAKVREAIGGEAAPEDRIADEIAVINARLRELAPKRRGLKPPPREQAKQWDEVFSRLRR